MEQTTERKARGQVAEIWHQFSRNKGAMVGSFIVLVIAFIAIFADVRCTLVRDRRAGA